MLVLGLSAQEWTAVATGATAAILAITAVYVGWQAHEARSLRGEQFRPWVVVNFHFRSNIAFIAIRNIGTTAARNISFRFDPELVTTLNRNMDRVLMFSEGIPILAPGEERLVLFDEVPDRLKSDLPKAHLAHVAYYDHERRPLAEDQFVLDFVQLSGADLPDLDIHDLATEVRAIRKHITDG